jgi:uncharacterized protein
LNEKPDFEGAISYSLERLRRELSPKLTYHNLWHTEGELLPGVARLGELCGINGSEMGLLQTAAAFHDLGYTETYSNHEIAAVRIVAQVLPRFGFSSQQIDLINGMIIATRLPQSPRTHLEEILADADLDVFGRADFFARGEALYWEKRAFGFDMDLQPWMQFQLEMVKSHDFFTAEARELRDRGKAQNIQQLQQRLSSL